MRESFCNYLILERLSTWVRNSCTLEQHGRMEASSHRLTSAQESSIDHNFGTPVLFNRQICPTNPQLLVLGPLDVDHAGIGMHQQGDAFVVGQGLRGLENNSIVLYRINTHTD